MFRQEDLDEECDGEYYKERYDAKTLSIAAENADDASAKLLFKDDKVGGSVKDLIYKGNGREYESIPSETAKLLI